VSVNGAHTHTHTHTERGGGREKRENMSVVRRMERECDDMERGSENTGGGGGCLTQRFCVRYNLFLSPSHTPTPSLFISISPTHTHTHTGNVLSKCVEPLFQPWILGYETETTPGARVHIHHPFLYTHKSTQISFFSLSHTHMILLTQIWLGCFCLSHTQSLSPSHSHTHTGLTNMVSPLSHCPINTCSVSLSHTHPLYITHFITHTGLTGMVLSTLSHCPIDTRTPLLKNFVVVGVCVCVYVEGINILESQTNPSE